MTNNNIHNLELEQAKQLQIFFPDYNKSKWENLFNLPLFKETCELIRVAERLRVEGETEGRDGMRWGVIFFFILKDFI